MTEQKMENTILEEINVLKGKFENIKKETEEFIVSTKHLSETGVKEAKDLIESAKKNWQGILSSFGGATFSGFFSNTSKKAGKKKTISKVKKVAKKVKKASKKR